MACQGQKGGDLEVTIGWPTTYVPTIYIKKKAIDMKFRTGFTLIMKLLLYLALPHYSNSLHRGALPHRFFISILWKRHFWVDILQVPLERMTV